MRTISMAEKEQRHYYYYLVLLTAGGVLLLAFIFLRKMDAPFSNKLAFEMRLLEHHKKMDERQREASRYLDKIFDKIDALPMAQLQGFTETDIVNDIQDIASIATDRNLNDMRKENYLQVADFLRMYLSDKKIAAAKLQNITNYDRQCAECNIGFKDKQQQLTQKNATISARSNP